MKIVFVLPGLHMSGGVISTIELANHLTVLGNDVCVLYPALLVGPRLRWYNLRSIYASIRASRQSRGPLFKRIRPLCPVIKIPTLHEQSIPNADAVIATWWETAYYVRSYAAAKGAKFYFVRGYEIWYGNEDLIKQTYSFPLKIIVTSTYLKNTIQEEVAITPHAIISYVSLA